MKERARREFLYGFRVEVALTYVRVFNSRKGLGDPDQKRISMSSGGDGYMSGMSAWSEQRAPDFPKMML
jgi:hypothetical protein